MIASRSPCVKFACSLQERCRIKKLACSSYAQYVRTGKCVDPRTNIQPARLSDDGLRLVGGGNSRKTDKPAPTREIYKLVDADQWGVFLPVEAKTQKADEFAAEVVASLRSNQDLDCVWRASSGS